MKTSFFALSCREDTAVGRRQYRPFKTRSRKVLEIRGRLMKKDKPLEILVGQQLDYDMTLGHFNFWTYCSGPGRAAENRRQHFTVKAKKAENGKPATPARKGYWQYRGSQPNFLDCSNYIGILKAFESYERTEGW
jgi:hypothetical protein